MLLTQTLSRSHSQSVCLPVCHQTLNNLSLFTSQTLKLPGARGLCHYLSCLALALSLSLALSLTLSGTLSLTLSSTLSPALTHFLSLSLSPSSFSSSSSSSSSLLPGTASSSGVFQLRLTEGHSGARSLTPPQLHLGIGSLLLHHRLHLMFGRGGDPFSQTLSPWFIPDVLTMGTMINVASGGN